MLGYRERLESIRQRHANLDNLSAEEVRILKIDTKALSDDVADNQSFIATSLTDIQKNHMPILTSSISKFEETMDRQDQEEEDRIKFVAEWYNACVQKCPETHPIILNNLCDLLEASNHPEVQRTIIELVQSWNDPDIDATLRNYYETDGMTEAIVVKTIMEDVRVKSKEQILELYACASLEDEKLLAELK
jgi:3-methyladenine DNA glycosylase AlkC